MLDVDPSANAFKRLINLHTSAYQLFLNGQDTISCSLTVCLLSSNDNHLWVAVLSGEVNFCVSFLPNLERKQVMGSNLDSLKASFKHILFLKYTVPSWYLSLLFQLCFCGTAWRWGLRQKSCSPPDKRNHWKLTLNYINVVMDTKLKKEAVNIPS